MTKVSRNDVFMRDEKGPTWFDEFIRSMAGGAAPNSVQDIMNAIVDKKQATVESVVAKYREQVGLDTLTDEDGGAQVKTASAERKLSIRHAKMGPQTSILPKIKNNKEVLMAIDSFCRHSGGTKNTPSIINHIRKLLGDETVSYTDQDLKDYIEARKRHFRDGELDKSYEVGLVGQEKDDDYDDDIADYQTYNGAK